jgi:hypothetical protein
MVEHEHSFAELSCHVEGVIRIGVLKNAFDAKAKISKASMAAATQRTIFLGFVFFILDRAGLF